MPRRIGSKRRIDLIEARLGQILVALIEQAHLGRLRRPGGIVRRQPRIFQLEQMEFDFEPGEEIETRRLEPRQRVAQTLAGSRTAPACRW